MRPQGRTIVESDGKFQSSILPPSLSSCLCPAAKRWAQWLTTKDAHQMAETSITIRNDTSEIRRLAKWAGLFCEKHQLGLAENRLTLVLEELLTNVISYGYDDDDSHEINVGLNIEDGILTSTFEDGGRPFDPNEAQKPVMDGPLEDRSVGGLGIHLILTIMDTVEYKRINGRNRITMTMATTP
jgi:anti-sigma regulatory factor (Ser/Thr protein kinase)